MEQPHGQCTSLYWKIQERKHRSFQTIRIVSKCATTKKKRCWPKQKLSFSKGNIEVLVGLKSFGRLVWKTMPWYRVKTTSWCRVITKKQKRKSNEFWWAQLVDGMRQGGPIGIIGMWRAARRKRESPTKVVRYPGFNLYFKATLYSQTRYRSLTLSH